MSRLERNKNTSEQQTSKQVGSSPTIKPDRKKQRVEIQEEGKAVQSSALLFFLFLLFYLSVLRLVRPSMAFASTAPPSSLSSRRVEYNCSDHGPETKSTQSFREPPSDPDARRKPRGERKEAQLACLLVDWSCRGMCV
ncbi:hypothetical protein BKA81DRAFT_71532 [Phyllosticta paracitricarpa]